MKNIHAFVRMGAVVICLIATAPQLRSADYTAGDLHQLYRSGRYFDCYRASAEAAKAHPNAAVPSFYAALALTRTHHDDQMRNRVRKPYGKALRYLEQARKADPQGRKLDRFRKGLAVVQRELIRQASDAYRSGNPHVAAFFDRLSSVFNSREGVWKNHYHHGRFLAEEGYDFTGWDNPLYRLADTGKNVPGISQEVRQILYLHNLCRMNPQLFLATYVKQFLGKDYHNTSDFYIRTLIEDLGKAEPRAPVYPDEGLKKAAMFHAKDLARNRIFGHTSSDGTSFSERVDRIAGDRNGAGENCAAGYNSALSCFMGLMIDRGVPSLGHRRNIMSRSYRYLGVGVVDPEDQWKIWVFDFAGS